MLTGPKPGFPSEGTGAERAPLAHQLLVASVERVTTIRGSIHVWVWHRGGVAVSSVEWRAVVHVVPSAAGVTPSLETRKEMDASINMSKMQC